MIRAIRNRLRAFRRYRQSAQFLCISAQYDKDAEFHRSMIGYHQEAEMHCKTLARAARTTARKIR